MIRAQTITRATQPRSAITTHAAIDPVTHVVSRTVATPFANI